MLRLARSRHGTGIAEGITSGSPYFSAARSTAPLDFGVLVLVSAPADGTRYTSKTNRVVSFRPAPTSWAPLGFVDLRGQDDAFHR